MRNVLVVWFGISGKSAAHLCKELGYKVYVYDEKDKEALNLTSEDDGICFVGKDFIFSQSDFFDFAVISPAVLPGNEIYDFLSNNGITMLSEIELGFRYCKADNVIAITGTNGKTSTALICNEVFKKIGIPQCIYGNMGIGFAEISPHIEKEQNVILEVSAQQLHATHEFSPHISVITNINPEHQSHYMSYEEYVSDKYRIYANQGKDDYCIINYDDENLLSIKNSIVANVIGFSRKRKLNNGASYIDGAIHINVFGKEKVINVGHTIRNDYIDHILIVALILSIMEIDFGEDILLDIPEMTFKHRLEQFGNHNERRFFDDSKATNPYSTIFALQNFKNMVLICGSNMKKKSDYKDLVKAIEEKGCWAVLYRESGLILFNELRKNGYRKAVFVNSLEEAVKTAYDVSRAGDAIIFSPAGNSSPLYENLYERGRIFKSIAMRLMEEAQVS